MPKEDAAALNKTWGEHHVVEAGWSREDMGVIVQHTNDPSTCQAKRVQELASSCDHEYYMIFAAKDLGGDRARIKRGRDRIEGWLRDLESLRDQVECLACQQEINYQLVFQREALQGIPDS